MDLSSAAFRAGLSCAVILALLAGPTSRASGEEKTQAHEAHPPHWTYEGETGPAHWADLAPEFSLCAAGHAQSPIDLSRTRPQASPELEFHYRPSHLNELNNGHTIQVNYDAGSWISVGGVRYDLAQVHFHIPSEHTVGGKPFAAEAHLVHRSADGHLAVIGLLIDRGAASRYLAPLWEHLPATEGPVHQESGALNAARLLPKKHAAWRYEGSLTTPPCTEGVHWFVLESPITLSDEQLERLRGILHVNNRPVQPVYERTVSEDPLP
ncbi:MAG TPA: carbonic anhydrase family protein [Candidatus Polarisedimenticolia bacterium]|nr:carbonic anhydrase family protein [Candidatus Polarisedimenticolia bacterium]